MTTKGMWGRSRPGLVEIGLVALITMVAIGFASCLSPSKDEPVRCPTPADPLYVCPTGTQCRGNGMCSGIIIDGGNCPTGTCNVGGECLASGDNVEACGASCTKCTGVTNGKGMCTAGTCDFECNTGFCRVAGTCSSTLTDAENCGGCGHKCGQGSTCNGGVCTAVLLANKLNYPTDMLLGPDGNRYFTEAVAAGQNTQAGRIQKLAPTDMMPSTFINSTATAPFHLAADDKVLYWTEQAFDPTLGRVRKAKFSDGMATLLAQGQNSPYSLTVARDGYLYWTTMNIILRISIAGGSLEVVVGGQGQPHGIVTTNTNVYWVNSGTGELMRAPLGAMQSAEKLFSESGSRPEALVHAGGSEPLYWSEARFGGAIRSWSFNSSGQEKVLENQSVPWALALDGQYLYFTVLGNGTDGAVKRMRTDGNDVLTLARGQQQPIAIAVDLEYVYWLNAGTKGQNDGELWKVAK